MTRHISLALQALLLLLGLTGGLLAAPTEKKTPPKDDYYELYKILTDTVDQVDRNYVKEIGRRELIEAAIQGVMNRLDPYSMYIGPQEVAQFRSSVESEFGGIGIHVSTETGDLRVMSPIYGSPAYRAGILPGDRILEIDGKPTAGLTHDEAVARVKGKEGTSVELTILHPGGKKREKIVLKREIVRVETVLGDRHRDDDTWDFMYDPQARLGYLRVSAFSRETAHELEKALEELKSRQVRAVILDLRFNPGGLLGSAIEVCDLFLSEGRIVSTRGRNTPERVWDAHKPSILENVPMVLLVNRYSASASEIVAGCLQDHKRVIVMGERTWGKGSVQNIVELEDGRSALKLTTATFHRPSGKNIHRFPDAKEQDVWGIVPDAGFDLRLSDREQADLMADRRERDILHPKHGAAPTAKPEPPKPEPAEKAKPEKAAEAKKPFVDRQLEMALKYLNGELARAK